MIAVDTNILVRMITRDDPAQADIADRVMAEPVIVPATVLLELAWVLGGKTYAFDRKKLAAVLRDVIDLASVTIEEEDRVRWAVDRYAHAGDIADLIHIATARGVSAFVSFDDRLDQAAGQGSPIPVRRPG